MLWVWWTLQVAIVMTLAQHLHMQEGEDLKKESIMVPINLPAKLLLPTKKAQPKLHTKTRQLHSIKAPHRYLPTTLRAQIQH